MWYNTWIKMGCLSTHSGIIYSWEVNMKLAISGFLKLVIDPSKWPITSNCCSSSLPPPRCMLLWLTDVGWMFDQDYLLFFVCKINVMRAWWSQWQKRVVHTLALVNKLVYEEDTSLSVCDKLFLFFAVIFLPWTAVHSWGSFTARGCQYKWHNNS